jgi:hypothetical protein
MDFRSRAGRRAGVSAAVAGLAVLLPAVAMAATASGPAAARPGLGGPAVPAPGCTAAHTRVWVGLPGDGTAGASFYQLEFSNIGPSTCSFAGFPGVSADRANGHRVGVPATRAGRDGRVTLLPGQTAHAILLAADAGAVCAHPVKAVELKVYPPNQTVQQTVPLAFETCQNRGTLQIRAVRDGAGIPGFTTR